jgi:hypothetical protein
MASDTAIRPKVMLPLLVLLIASAGCDGEQEQTKEEIPAIAATLLEESQESLRNPSGHCTYVTTGESGDERRRTLLSRAKPADIVSTVAPDNMNREIMIRSPDSLDGLLILYVDLRAGRCYTFKISELIVD